VRKERFSRRLTNRLLIHIFAMIFLILNYKLLNDLKIKAFINFKLNINYLIDSLIGKTIAIMATKTAKTVKLISLIENKSLTKFAINLIFLILFLNKF